MRKGKRERTRGITKVPRFSVRLCPFSRTYCQNDISFCGRWEPLADRDLDSICDSYFIAVVFFLRMHSVSYEKYFGIISLRKVEKYSRQIFRGARESLERNIYFERKLGLLYTKVEMRHSASLECSFLSQCLIRIIR